MLIKIAYLFLTLLTCIPLFAHSQPSSIDPEIVVKFTRREVTAANQDLIDLTVKIQNKSKGVLNARMNVELDKQLELISKNNSDLNLNPGDSLFLSVKIFVTQQAESGRPYPIRLTLINLKNQVIAEDVAQLHLNIKKNVSLYALVSNVLLEKATDSIRIPVRLSNLGNTSQEVTLICKYPYVVENGDYHATKQLLTPALKDTVVYFNRRVTDRMFPSEGFDVNITGLYGNGDPFGTAYVRIQNVRNSRQYRADSFIDTYADNSISLSTQGLFSLNQAYLLLGRGTVELPKGKMDYSLDVTTYKNREYSPTIVRSTYLGYEVNNMGLRVGNIYKNLEVNLNGRGALFFLKDTVNHNQYEAGYINSNYNLLGNIHNLYYKPGTASWASFGHNDKTWQLNSTALYEINPSLDARNLLLMNELRWSTAKQFRFLLNFNGGHSSEYTYSNSNKYSYAVGLTMSGTVKKLVVNSANYISSGYYPGLRRGALNFSERITLGRASGNNWLSVDYYRYRPKYLSNALLFEPDYSNFRAELGLTEKITKQLTLSIAPYFNLERSNSYQFFGIGGSNSFLRSWNVLTTLNIPISSSQYLSVNTEAGIFNSSFSLDAQFRLRSNFSYRFGIFNLSTYVQRGEFFIGEAINNYLRQIKDNYLVNITPNIQKSLFRNRLKTEFGVTYSKGKQSGEGWHLTGRTEYEFISKTSFFAAVNHNRYSFVYGQYSSSILEIGISKKMPSAKIGSKYNSLEVFLFKDINQNGIYDKGDSLAVNQLIYVNDVIFITKSDGTILYKNLPPGDYKIAIPKLKDWYTPVQTITFNKKQRLEIPLQKSGIVKGGISYQFDDFSYEVERRKEGIVVTAVDENKQTYLTKTDANGQYIFFVPVGVYSISILKDNLPPEVECINNDQMVTVSADIRTIDLILKIKQRKIEVKKFKSSNSRVIKP
ncbi:hypothetical protein [Pedobacter gandavensis]|uniref:hypothetical protein n=1 Tax=Pedobacter gandavensis TaxID=2679963 RepID=UPI00292E03C7|nr:hypothetical protein [Pedobacter gandavensis]